MTHWIKGAYKPQPDAHRGSGQREQVLYWWPQLVSPDRSATIGIQMLIGTIVWVVFSMLFVVLLATVLT